MELFKHENIMRITSVLLALGLFFSLSSCTKDRTGEGDGNDDGNGLSGLAADLDGEYQVQYIDFGGTISNPLGVSAPIDSSGNGTEGGFFNFNPSANKANYDVVGRIQFSIINQDFDIPIPVRGEGDLDVVSDTRFIIDDPDQGPTTFDVSQKQENSFIATTRVQTDTLSFSLDMTMDVKLERP